MNAVLRLSNINVLPKLLGVIALIGAIVGGWYSSRLLKAGVATGRARKRAMFFCALFALPASNRIWYWWMADSVWRASYIPSCI